ncbi:GNAT family N-acetyltransferase [Streptomyces lydicamycinicus]|uniref:GNAT family N-acetyltransferase n=1 Tax=Streptomyces lydicamycinicus TaxID=1546107 RepID=UPI001FE16E2C|nr:GNAT family N-acetyltransferase [Streptomyces lydicamycinicus]USA05086.1 GNAT family N-acetyltransferase [Streptomyces lydicamycinicus]
MVATRPDARRRGYARAVVRVLLDELRTEHVTLFELHASQEAAPLYREFGFADSPALMRMTHLEEPDGRLRWPTDIRVAPQTGDAAEPPSQRTVRLLLPQSLAPDDYPLSRASA